MNRHFEPVRLGSIEWFCRAAELGGFTAAAEVLGVTPGAVSRSVGRLEARLGVRLFARPRQKITPFVEKAPSAISEPVLDYLAAALADD